MSNQHEECGQQFRHTVPLAECEGWDVKAITRKPALLLRGVNLDTLHPVSQLSLSSNQVRVYNTVGFACTMILCLKNYSRIGPRKMCQCAPSWSVRSFWFDLAALV